MVEVSSDIFWKDQVAAWTYHISYFGAWVDLAVGKARG